jgi:flagellar basal-body rod protein FlgF
MMGYSDPKKSSLVDDLCGFCETSPTARVMSGMLEMSNVNPVHEMTDMINHQRQFEMQMKLMKKAEEMDEKHVTLLRIV